MANCTISIWGNPNGRGYIVNGRESGLMTLEDCNIRNIDGDSVFQGEFYSVMYTDRGYIISYHYTLKDEGRIASEFGGVINFRDPRTVISIAVPRGCTLDGPVEIFEKLCEEYYNVIGKLISIDELSSRVSRALPEWEELIDRNIVKGTADLRVNTKDERAKGAVVYQNLDDVNSYLVTLERLLYKGYKVLYFVPQTSAAFFASVTPVYAPVSFVPSYKVVFPDNSVKEISSLEEPIDVTVVTPNHEDLHFQGTLAAKMTEWSVRPSEDCSEYVIGLRPVPKKKVVPIYCTDLGTGMLKPDLTMLQPSVGHIEGSVLVLTGDEIDTARSAFNITVLAPYRRVDISKETSPDGSSVIKVQIVQRVSFNVDECIRKITLAYGFSPEIYCNGARVYGVIDKDITEARRCRITIKGSEDYETYEMDMPTDNWTPAINLKKREGRKMSFEVRGAEALEALKNGAKIEVYSAASETEDSDDRKGGKKGKPQQKPSGKPAPKLKSHRFFLSSREMEEEFDPSSMTAEREYRAVMRGFKTVTFRLPKRALNPIELDFKPTAGTLLRKNKGWIALIVLAFLLGGGAGFGLKCLLDHFKEQREAADVLNQAKKELAALSGKLETIDFTSADVDAVESFIKQHEELKDEEEVAVAKERMEVAELIMNLCSGNDEALSKVLEVKGLKAEQAKILRDIEAMPELVQYEQNSSSLKVLKDDLDGYRKANAEASADEQEKKAQFNRMCAKLNSLTCTIQQLDEIMKFAKDNGLEADQRYKQADYLRKTILVLTGKYDDPTTENEGKSTYVVKVMTNYIENRRVSQTAIDFLTKIKADQTVVASLPLDADCESLSQVKMAIESATYVKL